MQQRERRREEEPAAAVAPGRSSDGSAAALERAVRLGDRGQALLDRALSGNSERYLEAIRQRGGQ